MSVLETYKYSAKIVFTASNSWFGRLIRWVTKSSVSHVFLVIPIWGREFALESTVSGVRIVPVEKVYHHVESVWRIVNVPEAKLREGLIRVSKELGSPYDWAGSFILGLLLILKAWFKLRWRSFSWRTKALKCSELVSLYLWTLGYGTDKHEYVTPALLREWMLRWSIFERLDRRAK